MSSVRRIAILAPLILSLAISACVKDQNKGDDSQVTIDRYNELVRKYNATKSMTHDSSEASVAVNKKMAELNDLLLEFSQKARDYLIDKDARISLTELRSLNKIGLDKMSSVEVLMLSELSALTRNAKNIYVYGSARFNQLN